MVKALVIWAFVLVLAVLNAGIPSSERGSSRIGLQKFSLLRSGQANDQVVAQDY